MYQKYCFESYIYFINQIEVKISLVSIPSQSDFLNGLNANKLKWNLKYDCFLLFIKFSLECYNVHMFVTAMFVSCVLEEEMTGPVQKQK